MTDALIARMDHVVFDLKHWVEDRRPLLGKNDLTNFTSMLFDLIAKADVVNRDRLRSGFGLHVLAYEVWSRIGDKFLDNWQEHLKFVDEYGK